MEIPAMRLRFPFFVLICLLPMGLRSEPAQAQNLPFWADLYSQNGAESRLDLASQPESPDRIGSDLAVGDFNGDGYEDLVIGLVVGEQAFAYPINMLGGPQREIVNDEYGGVPFCVNW